MVNASVPILKGHVRYWCSVALGVAKSLEDINLGMDDSFIEPFKILAELEKKNIDRDTFEYWQETLNDNASILLVADETRHG